MRNAKERKSRIPRNGDRMRIKLGGFVAFSDDSQQILAVGTTPEEAINSIHEDDQDLGPFSTLRASQALIAEFWCVGPGGPTWLSVPTDVGEVACLEDEKC